MKMDIEKTVREDLKNIYNTKYILSNIFFNRKKGTIGLVKVEEGWMKIIRDKDKDIQLLNNYPGNEFHVPENYNENHIYYKLIPNERIVGYLKKDSWIPGIEYISIRYRDSLGVKSRTPFIRETKKSDISNYLHRAENKDYNDKEEKLNDILGQYKYNESIVSTFPSKNPTITLTNKLSKIILGLSFLTAVLSFFTENSFWMSFTIISSVVAFAVGLFVFNRSNFPEDDYICLALLDKSVILFLKKEKQYAIIEELEMNEIVNIEEKDSVLNIFENEIEIKTEDNSVRLLVDNVDEVVSSITGLRI